MIRKHQQLEGHSKSANFRKRYVIFLSLCSLCSPGDSSTFGGLPDLAIVSWIGYFSLILNPDADPDNNKNLITSKLD